MPNVRSIALLLAMSATACAPHDPDSPASLRDLRKAKSAIDARLDAFHAAAARSDEHAYFAFFTKDATFLGTDRTEHWSSNEFRAYAHPHFEKKKGWAMHATRREVSFSRDGLVAWFDEDLETKNLGPARGSGVLVREHEGAEWKVAQYNLSTVVPNALFSEVRRVIERPTSAPKVALSSSPTLAFADPRRAEKITALDPEIDALMRAEIEERHMPSLAVALVVLGRPLHVWVEGVADKKSGTPASKDTAYRVGSITKTVTATALMLLRDERKVALDDRVDAYLPEFSKVALATTDAAPITLRELLTHSSGLPRDGSYDDSIHPDVDISESEVLVSLDVRAAEPPGTQYAYSNFGVSIAALAASRVARTPYRELINERLIVPLGMTNSGFDPSKLQNIATGYATSHTDKPEPPLRLGASEGAGGLYASLDDMAKWVGFHLSAWPARDDAETGPVRRSTLREMHTPAFPIGLTMMNGTRGPSASSKAVGIGWHVKTTCAYERLVGHGGTIDGFNSQIVFAPDRGFGLVVLSNSRDADTSSIADKILAHIDQRGALLPRTPVFSPRGLELVHLWTKTLGDTDQAGYAALVTPDFVAHVPLVRMQDSGRRLRKRHGVCSTPTPLIPTRVLSTNEAELRIACEKGSLAVHAFVVENRLQGISVKSTGFPVSKSHHNAAVATLALLKTWDVRRADTLFAKEINKPKFAAAFATIARDSGTCTLGPGESDSANEAHFELHCPRGASMKLDMTLRNDTKVTSLSLTPNEDAHCQERNQ